VIDEIKYNVQENTKNLSYLPCDLLSHELSDTRDSQKIVIGGHTSVPGFFPSRVPVEE
jgi:hypothetical protein